MFSHFRCIRHFAILWTVACDAPLSMGILQARMLKWVAISSSRESSQTRDWICISYVSCIGRQVLYTSTTWEAPLLSSVRSLSCVPLFAVPWAAECQASLPFTNSQSLLKCMSIESVMPSIHLILCRPLLFLPSIFPSIRAFSNESVLHIRWPKYWSFSFSITPSNEYSELISFRIDCFDLIAIQGTVKSLLQHHSTKSSVLQHSAFFMRTEF